MVQDLRQGTATIIEVGPFVDKTDGVTLEEAITVTNLTVSMFKQTNTMPANNITNGTFDTDTAWVKGSNWQIDNGGNNLADQSTPTASDLSQAPSPALVENQAYEVVFTITNRSVGAIVAKVGGTSGTSRTTNATFTETIIAGSGADLTFTADGTWDGEVDTVTIQVVHREITPAASASDNDMVFADGGTYYFELSAADTGVLGRFKLVFEDVSDILPRTHEFMVLPANVWDSLYGSDKLQVDETQISGDSGAADNHKLQYDTTGLSGGTFPANQDQVGAIGTVGGAALSFAAADDNVDGALNGVTFVGTQASGTFASTEAEQGTYHQIDDTTNNIDLVYQFNIGGARTGSSLIWKGYLAGSGDSMNVQVYDFVGSDWETIHVIAGKNQAVNETITDPLLAKHTGTGANTGIVYIRFVVASGSDQQLNTDQIIVEAVNIGQSVGYALGRVWYNDNGGFDGVEPFVNGVAEHKSDDFADAITIANAVNLNDFHISNGASITLPAAGIANRSLFGDNWNLALASRAIGGAFVAGALVTGIGTSTSEVHFEGCDFGTATLELAHIDKGGFAGTITLNKSGDYNIHDSYSKGDTPPVFTKTSLVALVLEFQNYQGDITISGLESGDTIELGGFFRTIELNGADATVHVHGFYETIVNNASGLTLEITGAIQTADVAAILVDTNETQGKLPTNKFMGSSDGADDDGNIAGILVDTADMQPLIEKMAYVGPYGLGVWIDDGAANTNTVLGTDGIESNPVSTIAAATTIATSLGSQRFYLVNDTEITLAQTYEGHEVIGVGVMNKVTLGSQDVDNTLFRNILLTGTQGGTQFMRAIDCQLQAILSGEILADDCWLTGDIALRAAANHSFGHCKSGMPGNATPDLTFPGSGTTSVNFRHYSGGVTVKGATVNDTMSYESDGQIIIDATCTSLNIVVRGDCSITDNGTTTNLTQDAAINRTNINAEVVDALNVDTYAEPGQGTPAATNSLVGKIGFLYKAWRNRSNQTATTYQLFNDDASTVDHKATVSDDTTIAEKGEVETGP